MLPEREVKGIAKDIVLLQKDVEHLNSLEHDLGWSLIEDVEVGAAVASIDYQNIPTRFKHLRIMGWARGDNAALTDTAIIRFNNIAAFNYYAIEIRFYHPNTIFTIEGLAASSGRLFQFVAATGLADSYTPMDIFIPDYLDTSIKKAWFALSGIVIRTTTGNLRFAQSTGLLDSLTAAINRITVFPAVGNFDTGTRLSLYGMK